MCYNVTNTVQHRPRCTEGEFWIGEREVDTDRIVCYTVDIINNKRDI